MDRPGSGDHPADDDRKTLTPMRAQDVIDGSDQ
jgi:hypothetical protein